MRTQTILTKGMKMAAAFLILALAFGAVCYLHGHVIGKQDVPNTLAKMPPPPATVYPIHTMDKVN